MHHGPGTARVGDSQVSPGAGAALLQQRGKQRVKLGAPLERGKQPQGPRGPSLCSSCLPCMCCSFFMLQTQLPPAAPAQPCSCQFYEQRMERGEHIKPRGSCANCQAAAGTQPPRGCSISRALCSAPTTKLLSFFFFGGRDLLMAHVFRDVLALIIWVGWEELPPLGSLQG